MPSPHPLTGTDERQPTAVAHGRDSGGVPPSVHAGVEVKTPEHVVFSFEIAGIGSRGLAAVMDGLILFFLLTFLSGAFLMLLRGTLGASSRAWAIAILVIAIYGVVWGYFVYFETRWHGQTPGKRWLGLRVVQDSGMGIGFLEAAVRNVLRVADFLPVFFGVGLLVMFFNRRSKRLGDFVAGTMVVKEKRWVLHHVGPRDETVMRRARGRMDRWAESTRLSPEDYEILSTYLDRRKAFPSDVRLRLARALTAPHLRESGMPEEEIEALTLDDFEAWLKARVSALQNPRGESGGSRHLHDFVRRKQDSWHRLSALLDKAQGAPWSALRHADLRELGTHYRKVTADYAYARLRFPRTDALLYLNQLVARGHNAVYRRKAITTASILSFVTTTFPRAFRAYAGNVAVATGIFVAAAAFGFLSTAANEDVATLFLSREAIEEHVRHGELWTDDLIAVMPSSIASARILTNNVTVALLAFAMGITFGLGTVALLFLNGMMLGVISALCWRYDLLARLWTFIAAHGPLELVSIFLAAGAGLAVAQALAVPGNLRRGDALRVHGRAAMALVVGAVPLLFLAGFIEGFVSAGRLPAPLKILTGLVTISAFGVYVARSGREEPSSSGGGRDA